MMMQARCLRSGFVTILRCKPARSSAQGTGLAHRHNQVFGMARACASLPVLVSWGTRADKFAHGTRAASTRLGAAGNLGSARAEARGSEQEEKENAL